MIVGFLFTVTIYLSTLIPRGVSVNRFGVGVLMILAFAAFAGLAVSPERFRTTPWPLVFCVVAVAWTSALVLFTGGPKSDFFPLYFLILILAGAYAEESWEVAAVTVLVCIGYVSHLAFYGIMRDSFRDFLIIRVPVYFAAAFTTFFLMRERQHIGEEKNELLKLTSELDIKAKQMEALFSIGKEVSSKLKVKSVLDTIVASTIECMEVSGAAIHLFDTENSHLVIASSNGLKKESLDSLDNVKVGEGVAGWVAMTGEHLVVENVATDGRLMGYRGNSIASLLSVPMTVESRTIGVLSVYNQNSRHFSDDEVSFLSALAGEAAVAEEAALLYEKTEQLSLVDPLTNLYNIRKLHTTLTEEIQRTKRFGHPFAFIMADIDFFKEYNDNYGHQTGDDVLREVALLLVGSSRSVDMVFRYGGEEFCMVLPETEKSAAVDVAERIRRAIEEKVFEGEESQPNGSLTISMGIAVYPDDAGDGDTLVGLADKALYSAKHDGRNRVLLADKAVMKS